MVTSSSSGVKSFSPDAITESITVILECASNLYKCNNKVKSCSEKINNFVNNMGRGRRIINDFSSEITAMTNILKNLQTSLDQFNQANGSIISGEIDYAQYIANGGTVFASAADAANDSNGLSINSTFLSNPLDIYDTETKQYLHLTEDQLNDSTYMSKLAGQSRYILLYGDSYENPSGFVPLNKVFQSTSTTSNTSELIDKFISKVESGSSMNEFVNYYQYDYDDVIYYTSPDGSSYGTIKAAGCGTTSMAMVLTYLKGETIDPVETSDYSREHGTYTWGAGTNWDFFGKISEDYDINCTESSVTSENIVNSLSNGETVIMSMGPGTFTKFGHYIVLTGINDDGTISVADPNSEERSNTTYDIDVFLNEGREMWSFDN